MLLHWGDFDLSRVKYFSFLWNKFCIFPERISFWYSVIFRLPEPPSNIHCTQLLFVHEQGEQSGLLGSMWEGRGSGKDRFCRLAENRGWKDKKEIRVCRCKGKKCRIIGRIKAEEKQLKR